MSREQSKVEYLSDLESALRGDADMMLNANFRGEHR